MEVVTAIIGPIVESIMVPIKKRIGYLFSSTKHVRNMSTRMKQLDGASVDVKKHMDRNNISNLEIPTRVPFWLEEVEKIKEDAQSISSIGNAGCFNIKMRYRAGRNAFKITEEIGNLIKENIEMIWSDAQKPLGRVESYNNASTSALSDSYDAQNHFNSREKTRKDALELLQQDHTCKVLAICGMGGVGKTTLMEQLRKVMEDKKMFNWIVKVVVGQTINMFSVQQVVAEYIGQPLTETSKTTRADRLRIRFEKMSEEKKSVLVILDDVWETIDLHDIGLRPLPKGFKLLLTSRYEHMCKQIALADNLDLKVVRVDVMEELEAQDFFWQITGASKQYHKELNQIGIDIVRRCGFLPLAIKLIATTLESQEAFVWRNTLLRLKMNNLDKNVQAIIEISYDFIKEEEEKAIFLLCGLFPDDFDIPVEELTRYAWGLNLLSEVYTLGDARDRTQTCVQNLKSANLLINSDYLGCVKMHDLVLAFVLGRVSKGDHPWMINHGDISKLSTSGMSESCKRISITCSGMSEFPTDIKYPNLSLMRFMQGDKSLQFPEDFYEKMVNLQVIAYEKMQYPLLPRSLQCSTKLRTLVLHQCLLMFDCSAIGELVNLEVLSFAHCGIRKLPSAIGKLKELRLLDLRGCVDLRIDDGVLKNLVKLEELYMRVDDKKAIRFTDGNLDELAECSKHLSALEVEFFGNNGKPENILFTKLERFKISLGCSLKDDDASKDMHSFVNTLRLVTNKDELLESGMNELFEKTEVLYLEVDGMNDLEEVVAVESVPLPQHSFNNLKVLNVFKCANLRYLFTVPMASGLMKLEHLTISECPVLEFVQAVGSVPLPQHSFNNLKVLNVFKCANLRYLFTVPMASGLMKLERLTISECPVLEVVLAYSENGGDAEEVIKFQGLKFLCLDDLPNLVGFCNTTNVIELPELVELILNDLPNSTSIFAENKSTTSSMSSSNLSAIRPLFNIEVLIPKLEILKIDGMNELKEIWPCQVSSSDQINACMLREIEVMRCKNIVNLFPISNPMSVLRHLEELIVISCGSIEVLFNINMSCVGEIEEYRSNLRYINASYLGKLRAFWRMKGESSSHIVIRSFQALKKINIYECKSFMNLFTPIATNSDVRTLMNVSIDGSRSWEESLTNIELVEKSQESNVISEAQIFYLEELKVANIEDIDVVFNIETSSSSKDLTSTRHNHQPLLLPYLKELRLLHIQRMSHVWKCNWKKLVVPQNQSQSSFHNLTTISIWQCNSIKYLFSPLMAQLLPNLKKVTILECDGIEEVVSNRYDEDDEMATSISTQANTVSFPHLDELFLWNLPRLKSIDGSNAWGRSRSSAITSDTTITTTFIHDQFKCSQIGVASWFLSQHPKKLYIDECDALSRVFPSYVVGRLHKLEELRIYNCKSMMEVFERVNNDGDGSDDTCTAVTIPRLANMTLCELPNLTILEIVNCEVLEYIFTSSTLGSLKHLKELTVKKCKAMQVIVKELDGEHTQQTSKSIIVFPRLKSLKLVNLPDLKCFFLGTNEFQWPLLEKVEMYGCPEMMTFTSGHSTALKLKYVHTGLGKHSLECGLNFHLNNSTHETQLRMCCTPDLTKLLQFPWSFANLIEVDLGGYSYSRTLWKRRIIFPCNELLNLKNIEKLCLIHQFTIEEVFEVVERTNDDDVNIETQSSVVVFEKLKEVTLDRLDKLTHVWKSNRWIVLNFPNLTKVSINDCPLLGHVFTGCMVGSLLQLQELQVSNCRNMNVIVEDVAGFETSATEVIELPCLKSITLHDLPNLKGFFLGKEAFRWPSLDTLQIKKCPQITVFTGGQLTTSKVKLIETTFGSFHVTEDPNSFIKTQQQEGWQF